MGRLVGVGVDGANNSHIAQFRAVAIAARASKGEIWGFERFPLMPAGKVAYSMNVPAFAVPLAAERARLPLICVSNVERPNATSS